MHVEPLKSHVSDRLKGLSFAALSSSTFGLAPFFSVSLLALGYSAFEVLVYRWGIATLALLMFGMFSRTAFRLTSAQLPSVLVLSVCRAVTSLSLVFAYANISSGVASIIHFMYPLAVALGMTMFFGERKSWVTFAAIALSLSGATLLSAGDISRQGGDMATGLVCSGISVFSYAAYIIGVRKTKAQTVDSTALTCWVMGLGTVMFAVGGFCFGDGIRFETGGTAWLYILGIALPATAVSNMSLVKAIKLAGPTMTSLMGAMEPLTAVIIGVTAFHEAFTMFSVVGVALVLASVTLVLRAPHYG